MLCLHSLSLPGWAQATLLSGSLVLREIGGLNIILPTNFDTDILEAPVPGNYTLHYVNRNTSANVTGRVVMGPSSVTFSRPYFYGGLTTIAVAVGLSIVTGFTQRNKILTPSPPRNSEIGA